MITNLPRQWSPENVLLWNRILAHCFENTDQVVDFVWSLRQQNGWSLIKARKAIEEYRRFCFLACQREVCPSIQVDQVWHLHLLYTRDYWKEFCPKVLMRELHHGPSKGGRSEDLKHRGLYLETIQAYEDWFGELPSKEFWQVEEKRFSPASFWRWIDVSDYWIIPKYHKWREKCQG